MPIDYFDPTHFNSLQLKLCAKAVNYAVALLPNVEESLTGCPDEKLNSFSFNELYAEMVAAEYNLVDDMDLILADSEDKDDALDQEGGEDGIPVEENDAALDAEEGSVNGHGEEDDILVDSYEIIS